MSVIPSNMLGSIWPSHARWTVHHRGSPSQLSRRVQHSEQLFRDNNSPVLCSVNSAVHPCQFTHATVPVPLIGLGSQQAVVAAAAGSIYTISTFCHVLCLVRRSTSVTAKSNKFLRVPPLTSRYFLSSCSSRAVVDCAKGSLRPHVR